MGHQGLLLLTEWEAAPRSWDGRLPGSREDADLGQLSVQEVYPLRQQSLPFSGLLSVVFPHFGSMGTKGLFSSWTGSCIIFRNNFQQKHATLVEREERHSALATGSGSCCSWAAGSGGVLMGERRAVWPQTEKATSRPRQGVGCGQCSVPSSAGEEAN